MEQANASNQSIMDAMSAVKAVVAIARSNFPSDTLIQISALGRQTATVTLPSTVFAQLLKESN